ncbi:unnamed protein product, partial [Soboliphyme baturini]|uniref:Uncharacterized protein n=1 Tax=Soboliphyme baturini TaxID=241478 RepID=A0A183IVS4_9BILA
MAAAAATAVNRLPSAKKNIHSFDKLPPDGNKNRNEWQQPDGGGNGDCLSFKRADFQRSIAIPIRITESEARVSITKNEGHTLRKEAFLRSFLRQPKSPFLRVCASRRGTAVKRRRYTDTDWPTNHVHSTSPPNDHHGLTLIFVTHTLRVSGDGSSWQQQFFLHIDKHRSSSYYRLVAITAVKWPNRPLLIDRPSEVTANGQE